MKDSSWHSSYGANIGGISKIATRLPLDLFLNGTKFGIFIPRLEFHYLRIISVVLESGILLNMKISISLGAKQKFVSIRFLWLRSRRSFFGKVPLYNLNMCTACFLDLNLVELILIWNHFKNMSKLKRNWYYDITFYRPKESILTIKLIVF